MQQQTIDVAFVVGPVCNLIDFAGPWETFAGVLQPVEDDRLPVAGDDTFFDDSISRAVFSPCLVSDSLEPVKAGNRIRMLVDHTYETAPAPKIIVIGAQTQHTPRKLAWIREMSRTADVVMSVCTGAYLLAATGLLDGRRATTHHDFYDDFAATYPKVEVVRGVRYVESGNLKTAGGLTSGIHLAVNVVAEMLGRDSAAKVADFLEFVPEVATDTRERPG